MRADRLISILMLLQARGRLTAAELAKELEVSERTIYRDIDALSYAGVPVYGEVGREGGYALLDSYRTSLTGLTEGETRALLMLNIPAPLKDLGLGQDLHSGLLKLSASITNLHKDEEERIRRRFFLDSIWWRQGGDSIPHLHTIYTALKNDRCLILKYQPEAMVPVVLEAVVQPYGLVAKAGVWYLVFSRNEKVRVRRVAHLLAAEVSDQVFDYPVDFDLETFWKSWCAERERRFKEYRVEVRISPEMIPYLPMVFGERVQSQQTESNEPDSHGWISLELSFDSLESARSRLLGLGGSVEVLRPVALRKSLADYARQIVDLYERGSEK